MIFRNPEAGESEPVIRQGAWAFTAPFRAAGEELRGLVELTPKCDPHLVRDLALAAYEASLEGPVVLALSGISRHEVDRILDPLVARAGRPKGDIRYLPFDTVGEELLDRARRSRLVVAQSCAFSSALLSRGIRYMSAPRGLRILREAAARAPTT